MLASSRCSPRTTPRTCSLACSAMPCPPSADLRVGRRNTANRVEVTPLIATDVRGSTTEAVSLPGEPPITPALVREHNLNDMEYGRILEVLGRDPTFTELGVFSALWSEHCSYKHSKPVLKTFPTTGAQVVQGPGENAGVLRLPEGWAVAFKIESHNHPSAVEPYQGAATGVGARDRGLRELRRGPHARRRGQLRSRVHRQSAGERDVRGTAPRERSDQSSRARRRQRAAGGRGLHRPRRHSRGQLCVGGTVREEREPKAPGPGGRSLYREAAAGSEPGADHLETDRGHSGYGSCRTHQLLGGDGRAGWRRGGDRHRAGSRPGSGNDAVRDSPVRVPGADAGSGRAIPGSRGPGGVRQMGAQRHRNRPGDRRWHVPGQAPWADGRLHSRPPAGRRLPGLSPRGGRG